MSLNLSFSALWPECHGRINKINPVNAEYELPELVIFLECFMGLFFFLRVSLYSPV